MANPNVPDLCGQRFERLLVVSRAGSDKRGNSAWNCVCDCGAERRVLAQSLRSGATKSCGCFAKDAAAARQSTHCRSRNNDYKAWYGILQRCLNPANPKWPRYGGRGITVCDEWRTFEGFLLGMGERPEGMTLDRIDNDGNYEPGNCRWATQQTQASNRGNNRRVTIEGRDMTLSEASRFYGISKGAVAWRLRNGWPIELALTTPSQRREGTKHGTAI